MLALALILDFLLKINVGITRLETSWIILVFICIRYGFLYSLMFNSFFDLLTFLFSPGSFWMWQYFLQLVILSFITRLLYLIISSKIFKYKITIFFSFIVLWSISLAVVVLSWIFFSDSKIHIAYFITALVLDIAVLLIFLGFLVFRKENDLEVFNYFILLFMVYSLCYWVYGAWAWVEYKRIVYNIDIKFLLNINIISRIILSIIVLPFITPAVYGIVKVSNLHKIQDSSHMKQKK